MLRASWGIRRMQEYHLCEQLSLLRLTTAAICGSDLHMYEGRAPLEPGTIFGHENLGVIEEVGAAVKTIRRGDRVVLPFNIACGFCFNCARQFPNACLTTDPQGHSALKLPGTPGDEFEDDFVLLADVFPTGFHATQQAGLRRGDTVAIWGAGPVGPMAALSARIRGASETYVVDCASSIRRGASASTFRKIRVG